MNSTKSNTYDEDHPEQDPAEGSRDVINHDLAETDKQKGRAPEKNEAGSKDAERAS